MTKTCVHSCKGLCNALEVAELRETEAIRQYKQYLESCDYPDVRQILAELIEEREKTLKLLQEKRATLQAKFSIVDSVGESFS